MPLTAGLDFCAMSSSVSSLLIMFALWLGLTILCCGGGGGVNERPLTASERAEALRDKEKACSVAKRLQDAGGFTKIQAGYSGVTHAYVGRPFFEVDVDAKKTALQSVALCHIDLEKRNQLGVVVIHDGYSGKRIGTFDFASGLQMD